MDEYNPYASIKPGFVLVVTNRWKYFDTFAPVINWTTVRLMLILTLILNLSTCQVDYTAAFVHSPINHDPNWENMSQQERDRSGVHLEMP